MNHLSVTGWLKPITSTIFERCHRQSVSESNCQGCKKKKEKRWGSKDTYGSDLQNLKSKNRLGKEAQSRRTGNTCMNPKTWGATRRHQEQNRRSDSVSGNNTGWNTNWTNEEVKYRRRDTGNRAVLTRLMWDRSTGTQGELQLQNKTGRQQGIMTQTPHDLHCFSFDETADAKTAKLTSWVASLAGLSICKITW